MINGAMWVLPLLGVSFTIVGRFRVLRGGSWICYQDDLLHVSSRTWLDPGSFQKGLERRSRSDIAFGTADVSFRCAGDLN
jgi:hypothetical protein